MGQRLNWNRARPRRYEMPTRVEQTLECQADKLLNLPHLTLPGEDERLTPERGYFRSIGSVLNKDGKWFAVDADGRTIGEFAERWQAWQCADKLGMQRVVLP